MRCLNCDNGASGVDVAYIVSDTILQYQDDDDKIFNKLNTSTNKYIICRDHTIQCMFFFLIKPHITIVTSLLY